jgi:DNA polymerase-3 subunit beta
MKLTIRTSELTKALYRAQGIAGKKSAFPILAHVLLDASSKPGSLIVNASDAEVSISGVYAADVAVPGRATVLAKNLYDVAKSLSKESVELERLENNMLEIRSGNSRFRLLGVAPDDFPEMGSWPQGESFVVPSGKMAQMIDRTVLCVSQDENRPNLSGIFCEALGAKQLRMVATDGHRLSASDAKLETSLVLPKGVVVPRKAFSELRRVLGDEDAANEPVHVAFSGTAGWFRVGAATLCTRLIEGQFPDYRQVIPSVSEYRVKIGRAVFAEALKRVSLLSQARSHGVKLEFSPSKVTLVAQDPEQGDASESVDVEYQGPELSMGMNARYVLDILNLIPEQGVLLEFTDDFSPAVLRPLEDPGFLAVVMPMRV